KDFYAVDIPNRQLAGEWVDFYNSGSTNIVMDDVVLYHMAYTREKPNGEWKEVMDFQGTLAVGKSVRIHSGGEVPLTQLNQIDITGVDHHLFTGKGYIWNNSKSDTAGLWDRNRKIWIDKASYDAYPPEGKILKRYGDKLI
ncbi:MAG: hypothetical protein GX435_06800, partial [Exilispira sp.]|nr:hypothetical protein [Exilispira sp.]